MTSGRLFWGVGFITLGVLFLLRNVFQLNALTDDLYKLWPAILILLGAGYLLKNPTGKLVLFAAGGLFTGVVVFSSVLFPFNHWRCNSHTWKGKALKHFTAPYNAKIKKIELSLDAGAGEFIISDDSVHLVDIGYPKSNRQFRVEHKIEGETANISVKLNEAHFQWDDKDAPNGMMIKLHTAPDYEMDLSLGAASGDYDLSKLHVSKLNLDMGAASLRLKLGMPRDSISEVSCDFGASSVHLLVPKGVGIRLEGDLSLSSVNLDGMNKEDDSLYLSENYEQSAKKINIKIDCGVSSVDLTRY
jgi:hypothetical protein